MSAERASSARTAWPGSRPTNQPDHRFRQLLHGAALARRALSQPSPRDDPPRRRQGPGPAPPGHGRARRGLPLRRQRRHRQGRHRPVDRLLGRHLPDPERAGGDADYRRPADRLHLRAAASTATWARSRWSRTARRCFRFRPTGPPSSAPRPSSPPTSSCSSFRRRSSALPTSSGRGRRTAWATISSAGCWPIREPLEILGDGTQTKSYLYIDDVIDAITQLPRPVPAAGIEVYNVATGDYITVTEIARLAADSLGLGRRRVHLQRRAAGLEGRRPGHPFDTQKLRATGWRNRYSQPAGPGKIHDRDDRGQARGRFMRRATAGPATAPPEPGPLRPPRNSP